MLWTCSMRCGACRLLHRPMGHCWLRHVGAAYSRMARHMGGCITVVSMQCSFVYGAADSKTPLPSREESSLPGPGPGPLGVLRVATHHSWMLRSSLALLWLRHLAKWTPCMPCSTSAAFTVHGYPTWAGTAGAPAQLLWPLWCTDGRSGVCKQKLHCKTARSAIQLQHAPGPFYGAPTA